MILAEFVLARLDELEMTARLATPGPWQAEPYTPPNLTESITANVWAPHPWYEPIAVGNRDSHGACLTVDAQHIALHNPAYVLADCRAKRKIVELHTGRHECVGDRHGNRGTVLVAEGYIHANDPTLRLLAQPFAAHPDFDPEWQAPA